MPAPSNHLYDMLGPVTRELLHYKVHQGKSQMTEE